MSESLPQNARQRPFCGRRHAPARPSSRPSVQPVVLRSIIGMVPARAASLDCGGRTGDRHVLRAPGPGLDTLAALVADRRCRDRDLGRLCASAMWHRSCAASTTLSQRLKRAKGRAGSGVASGPSSSASPPTPSSARSGAVMPPPSPRHRARRMRSATRGGRTRASTRTCSPMPASISASTMRCRTCSWVPVFSSRSSASWPPSTSPAAAWPRPRSRRHSGHCASFWVPPPSSS